MGAHPLYITSSSSLPSCSNLLLKLPIFAFTALSLGSGYLMICSGLFHCRSLTAQHQRKSLILGCEVDECYTKAVKEDSRKHHLLVSWTLQQRLIALPAVLPAL